MTEPTALDQNNNQPVDTNEVHSGDISQKEIDYFFDNDGNFPDDKKQEVAQNENSNQIEPQSAKDDVEEYKPEDYQHNKNYKQAMEAERREKAELKKLNAQMREENEKLKQTFEKLIKVSEQHNQQQAPSFEDDPIGALRHENELAKKKLEAIEQTEQQRQEAAKNVEAEHRFLNHWHSQATEFQKQTPDFNDAYQFIIKSRFDEYQAVGYSPQQAVALCNEDEAAIVVQALQQGVNPAERIYSLAKMRGYTGKANNQTNSNQDKFHHLEKGVKASKSVNVGGQSSSDNMTLEAIAAMDDDEFSKVDWDKVLRMG